MDTYKGTPGERIREFAKRRDVRLSFLYSVLWTAFWTAIGIWLYPKFMPAPMSETMNDARSIMVDFTVISAPIVGLVLGIATYTFTQRHTGDTPPEEGPAIAKNNAIVTIWTVVSSLFVLLAVVWGLIEMGNHATENADARNALVIEVTGSQWVWSYYYPELGIETQNLNLPIDRPVVFRVSSADVNHSFWPVQLGVKVDANRLQTTIAKTTPTVLGHFDIKCAELCGLYHAYMESDGQILTTEDFNKWVEQQKGLAA